MNLYFRGVYRKFSAYSTSNSFKSCLSPISYQITFPPEVAFKGNIGVLKTLALYRSLFQARLIQTARNVRFTCQVIGAIFSYNLSLSNVML